MKRSEWLFVCLSPKFTELGFVTFFFEKLIAVLVERGGGGGGCPGSKSVENYEFMMEVAQIEIKKSLKSKKKLFCRGGGWEIIFFFWSGLFKETLAVMSMGSAVGICKVLLARKQDI